MDLAEIGFWAVSGKNLHAPAAPGRGAEADRGGLGITLVWYFTHLEPRGARRWASCISRGHVTPSRKQRGKVGDPPALQVSRRSVGGPQPSSAWLCMQRGRTTKTIHNIFIRAITFLYYLTESGAAGSFASVVCCDGIPQRRVNCVSRCAWPASGKILKFLCEQ